MLNNETSSISSHLGFHVNYPKYPTILKKSLTNPLGNPLNRPSVSHNLGRSLRKHMKHGKVKIILGWRGNLKILFCYLCFNVIPSCILIVVLNFMKPKVLLLSFINIVNISRIYIMLGLFSNLKLNPFMTSHKTISCNTLAGSTQIYIYFKNFEIFNKKSF